MDQKKIIKKTTALCSVCVKPVDSVIFEQDEIIWLEKTCREHGTSQSKHLLANPRIYYCLQELHKDRSAIPEGLILKLTHACDQACAYCYMRANEESIEVPSFEELMGRAAKFRGDIIYVSGGEPTLRDDLTKIIRTLRAQKKKVVLFTNGKKCVDIQYVAALKKAGLNAVILQFDSLRDTDYEKIRSEKLWDVKERAIYSFMQARLPVMLYVNIVEGINDQQIQALFEYALSIKNVRILFFNPVWNIGRRLNDGSLDASDMLERVVQALKIPEEYFCQSIRFSTYLFEIIRKLGFRKGIKEPPCSVSCYLVRWKGGYKRLNEFFDINLINGYLKQIDHALTGCNNCFSKIRSLVVSPWIYCITLKLICRPIVWNFACKSFVEWIKNIGRNENLFFMSFNVLSIMVGRFPDKHSMDFSLFATCNMHTETDDGGSLPTCLREVYADAKNIAEQE